jgi:hypothetical protein
MDNPTLEFAKNFNAKYAPVKTLVDRVDKEVKLTAVARSKILFPAGKKKSITKFKAMSLDEKLHDIDEDKHTNFLPESLPGISRQTTNVEFGRPEWYTSVYANYTQDPVKQIIDSWYAQYSQEGEN